MQVSGDRMARPSKNLDEKLILAGRELIREQGLTRLSLRAVAAKAGVNLGMFHYHFKDKGEFIHRCLGDTYAEFYKGFEIQTSSGASTVEKLRRGLLALGRFSRENRHFVLCLMRDLEEKSSEAWNFMRSNFPPPHGKVIAGLIKQGQKEGSLIKVPLPTAMSVLMSGISFPCLIGGLAERALDNKLLSVPRLAVKHYFLSDKAITMRAELALRCLLKHPTEKL
jgi:AcrR family transcriptional regulator